MISRLMCFLFGHGKLSLLRQPKGSTKIIVECRRCGSTHTKEIQ